MLDRQVEFIIGIDSGGTKSHIAVWSPDQLAQIRGVQAGEGQTLAAARYQERFPGINLDVVDHFTATQRLNSMLEQAAASLRLSTLYLLEHSLLVMGLAGLDTSSDEQRAEIWMRTSLMQLGCDTPHFQLLPDVELALWSASQQGTGIVLIAGTGSNCFGRDQAGHRAKTGGVSHFFSDEGGGFMLGWEALHVVGKMNDGRLQKSALYEEILAAYHVPGFAGLKYAVVSANDYKKIVAQAAPTVQKLAAQGESESGQIVERNLQELQKMVTHVMQQLDNAQQLPVFLVGSLFKDDFYRNQLVSRLYQEGIRSQPLRIENPVVGVVNFVGKKG